MAETELVRVASRVELQSKLAAYAAQGLTTVRNDGYAITLSRKKPFNWVLGIICLFIPILGWIALVFMLMAAGRGHQVVELRLAAGAPA